MAILIIIVVRVLHLIDNPWLENLVTADIWWSLV